MANFNMKALLGNIQWGSLLTNLLLGTTVIVCLTIFIVCLLMYLKNKFTFCYPVSLIRVHANGSHSRRDDLRGGLVKQKNGVQDFVVKMPRQFKKKKLGLVPDFSLTDSKGRIVFITVGDGMVWQQGMEKVITEKVIEIDDGEGNLKQLTQGLLIEPIPTDVKTITINNIHEVDNLMEANRLKAAAILVGGFVLMVLVQIIFLFLTSK